MSIKKQLSLGLMSAVLGLALIGGGTYAYFSDEAETNNTFAAGTLDLSVDPTTIIDVDNLKPGDSMVRSFVLTNEGSLDIDTVYLETDYTVDDIEGDNTEDFGEHILVEFLYNVDELREVVYETTLAELKDMTPEAINEHIFDPMFDGLEVGSENDLFVNFEFVDNEEDQNQFQGDSLDLTWTFVATHGDGEER